MRLTIKVLCTCIIMTSILPSLSAHYYNIKSVSEVNITILDVQVANENCNQSDGSITVIVDSTVPGIEFSIDAGITFQTDPFFGGLESGDYLVVASVNGQCTDVWTSQISQLDPPTLTIEQECVPGKNRSAIIAIADGGNRNYAYTWSGPNGINESNSSINNLPPGFYSVTVSDDLGCSSSDTLTLMECCELEVACDLDPIQVSCLSDIPEEDAILTSPVATQSEIMAVLATKGITPSNGCTDLVLDFEETIGTSSICADGPLIITRVIKVADAFGEFPCSYQIEVEKHVDPTLVNLAEEMRVSCAATAQQEFDQWLANHGDMIIDGCSGPYIYSTFPETLQMPTDCGETIGVRFDITDACGNILSSQAGFTIEDTVDPILDCPSTLVLDPLATDNLQIVEDWLELASATDNCFANPVQSDLDPSLLVIDCNQSLNLDVVFASVDGCDNTGNCLSLITMAGQPAPTFTCGDNLNVACDDDFQTEIDNWLQSFVAEDATGNPIQITYDLLLTDLEALNCDETLPVNFSIKDDCDRTLDCDKTISKEDNVDPTLICPDNLILSSTETDATNIISMWIREATATDNCTPDVNISADFSGFTDLCSAEDTDVVFETADACDNTATCRATIIIDKSRPKLTCPNDLNVSCDEMDLDQQTAQWLTEATASDNDGNSINSDFGGLPSEIGCDLPITITFTTINDCGLSTECEASIQIRDDQAPIIACPGDLEITLPNANSTSIVSDWLEEASATDCNSYTIGNDFDLDLNNISCFESVEITFSAEDFCGLTSNCSSRLTLDNPSEISIEACPEVLDLTCGDPRNEAFVENHLNTIQLLATTDYEITTDFDPASLDVDDCSQAHRVEIFLEAEDECDKTAECRTYIEIRPIPSLYVPNVISPDRDGLNDYFTAYGNESVDYIRSLSIFNRWGSIIFSTTDIAHSDETLGWNGSFDDSRESNQVFTYMIEAVDIFGNSIEKVGTLQVLR